MKRCLRTAAALFAGSERRYEGKPVFAAGMSRRYVIWEQGGLFRLRTTAAGVLQRFHGVIRAGDGTFTEVRLIRLEPGDWVKRSRDDQRLYFSFSTRRRVDGLNFRTDASRLDFRLRVENREAVPATEIFLGRQGRHPVNNPFALFVWEAERGDDRVKLELPEPGKDDFDVIDLVISDKLEEESRAAD
jgi:hypothetical protein